MSDHDPMRDRRRNSAKFYDDVDAAVAARPKEPSHITTVTPLEEPDEGIVIAVDDHDGTRITITVPEAGRLSLTVATDTEDATVVLPLFAVGVLDGILRDLAGLTVEQAAPITGSR